MILLIFLFIFWFALVGKVSTDTIIVGIIINGLVFTFVRFFLKSSTEGSRYKYKPIILMHYLFTLVIEVFKANIEMIRIVLFEKAEDEHPSIARFKSNLQTDAAKTMLAHAITLTPGTITIGMIDDTFYVTGMNPDMLDGIDDSEFIHILHQYEL